MNVRYLGFLFLVALLVASCAGEDGPVGDDNDSGIEGDYFDEDYGKALFDEAPQPGKDDSLRGITGLPASVDNSDTVVWEVRNQWHETETDEANQAGMAWPANSGLTWDEKYAAWISSMERIDGHNTYYETFQLTTPHGKTLPAPALECAETSIFLRVTFASWYGLPFYMEAGRGENRVFFGHFGARGPTDRYKTTPRFKNSYSDHRGAWSEGDAWPVDAKLKARKIWGTAADDQPFLGEDAHLGAYFDEIFLNKRTGYFLMLMLSYYGSVNLADANNTFNLVPEAVQPGDTLLERWQRRGIGHTLVVKTVNQIPGGRIEAELVSGSMPRRQPKWEDGASSKRSFTLQNTGGEGTNPDGDRYAALGGGIKRWRTARIVGGVYRNVVPTAYQGLWIANYDMDKISARPEQFEAILGEVSPEELREVVLRQIDDARSHLRNYPASCSARIRREDAFRELYALQQERFGLSTADTDAEYRKLEDYVFAELEYEKSKTCCWNSTTSAMWEIVMAYNEERVYDSATMTCNEVTVFKNTDSGYDVFKSYADSIDRGGEWVAWSEDEPCAQRDVASDTIAASEATPACQIIDNLVDTSGGMNPVDPSNCPDAFVGNTSRMTAPSVASGSTPNLAVCDDASDWFAVTLAAGQTLTAEIAFAHAEGDLDMTLIGADGSQIDVSESTDDVETITHQAAGAGDVYVRVYGYSGAANTYTLNITVE